MLLKRILKLSSNIYPSSRQKRQKSTMALLTKKCFRMFLPAQHLWIETISSSHSHRWLRIGLTQRGLEDIGDITSIQPSISAKTGGFVDRGQDLMRINFDGHSITSADELYHTVWDTFSDQVSIFSPLPGLLLPIAVRDEKINEDTSLATLKVSEDEWQQACERYLVHESQYRKLILNWPRGKFSD
jgi:hypothetical protein